MQLAVQVLAFDELHDHRDLVVVLKGSVEPCDVRVRQPGKQTDLPQKAVRKVGAIAIGAQQFQRFHPLRDDVAHLVHLANAPLSQVGDDLVVADVLSGPKWHRFLIGRC